MTKVHDNFDLSQDSCLVCGGRLKSRTTSFRRTTAKKMYFVDNVPAWVCTQCGEKYYAAETLEEVDRIVETTKPVKMIEVPLYRFPQTVPAAGTGDEDETD